MNFSRSILIQQREICKKYGSPYYETPLNLKVGISLNVKDNVFPINGFRHQPEGDTSGWYIWAGEKMSDDPNFFVPLHASHLYEWNQNVLKYLGLAPGWRFLIGENKYEDVWQDEFLLFT